MPPGMLFYYRFSISSPPSARRALCVALSFACNFCSVLFSVLVYPDVYFVYIFVTCSCHLQFGHIKCKDFYVGATHMCARARADGQGVRKRGQKSFPFILSVGKGPHSERSEFQWKHLASPVLLDRMSCGYGHSHSRRGS